MNFLAEAAAYNEFFKSGMAYIGAGIAVFTGVGAAIGEGNVAAKAVEAIGRQPEASGKITITMLIGQAVAETTGLYGFIVALMLLGK
ncbi:MAG TPA: ATP synthase F0 subunit C [Candidatus Pelethenecus faecipullorum]|uniref:ATP synthase subunit c n=1 Tax=Candidatus Pelethenecus faecipullorum TaxID=2840900 RepID=A0A9D1KIJ9_9MOLU|nr:ATP synthase F0 subunit C [Candidatus Pelethenecus faecipullorum]